MKNDKYLAIIELYKSLNIELDELKFFPPCFYVYNPLSYCFESFKIYFEYLNTEEEINLFFGINPGPFGMAQTGIPFGDKETVKNYLKIEPKIDIDKIPKQHPKKQILGLEVKRVEKSGRIFWGVIKEFYPEKYDFFKSNFVLNFCPLCFLDEQGRNITPKVLRKEDQIALYKILEIFMLKLFKLIKIKKLIAIGDETFSYLNALNTKLKIQTIIHPAAYKSPEFIKNEYKIFLKELN